MVTSIPPVLKIANISKTALGSMRLVNKVAMAASNKSKAKHQLTPYLIFCSIAFLQGAILFGMYDMRHAKHTVTPTLTLC